VGLACIVGSEALVSDRDRDKQQANQGARHAG
jgi:hypothetical protein